ncbi:hypothetical protein RhiJN_13912 [Ceratobasidium sp. AG-Ba]|nr:hypothetical protein RhiJN_13912 [Ceratobasidium sp. AG-Ba]QRW14470.1 hypothetical protein RhiLY_13469 [Ceratobasidium sp. AG-Ba]
MSGRAHRRTGARYGTTVDGAVGGGLWWACGCIERNPEPLGWGMIGSFSNGRQGFPPAPIRTLLHIHIAPRSSDPPPLPSPSPSSPLPPPPTTTALAPADVGPEVRSFAPVFPPLTSGAGHIVLHLCLSARDIMPSRHDSVSLRSFDSPPSQTRLAYPLVPQPSTSMHDQHTIDYPDRFSVEPYGVHDSSADSPPYDYPMGSSMGVGALGLAASGAARPKRKQVKNACSACQRACKRCDVGRPCERCIKYGMQDSCRDSLRKERKKGVKRGPYKKRDGESTLPAPRSVADVAPPAMINDLQRMNSVPVKTRTSRVSSISDAPSLPSTSAEVEQAASTVPLYIQSVPSARPSEGSFPYSTAVMIPASTQHPSLASMHSSSSHANIHQSTRGEDQYYQPRYDHLAQGSASARPSQYRMDSYPAHQQQQEYQTKQVPQMVDHRSIRTLHYPSSDESPPRERQYSQIYNDTPQRHTMIQASSAHHDVSYSQPDSINDSPRAINAQYSYPNQQPQRSYERSYQERAYHDRSYPERSYSQDRTYQDRTYPDRSYAAEVQMQDTSTQPEIQQPQAQQQQYYSSYNNYQNQSSSNYTSQSYYSQNHASHSMAPTQHVSDQTDSGYMNRPTPDQVSYGSSINSYPTQQQESYPSQHSMSGTVQYPMRSTGRIIHRDMVGHPQVGNVQIQSS